MSERKQSAFELVDRTDEEMYYPLGIFLTLKDAVDAVEQQAEPWQLSEQAYDGDYVRLEIRERQVGLSQHGEVVWSRSWENIYDEARDECSWKARP